ncbi:MAG: tetratricopeptide repeat protein [Candidatus Moranbacteria bacterium]|nr:tetratricopeptide repeat protein [Candidatus Moranbacteria bacterium]
MGLDNSQKNYIKKNLRHLPVSKIAADLGLPENEVLDYLKKKWSPEKFEKFRRNQHVRDNVPGQSAASFSFISFFRENLMVLAFLAFLVIAAYANSFGNGFVSDDIGGFATNKNIGNISNIFAGPAHFSVSALFQLVAFHIGGLHPFTFRAINIFFHLGCVILIYILLSLSMNKRVAVIAASLFAVHPILTESVTWISGGLYSIYAFFFLLSFLFYLFSQSSRKYFKYAVIFFILSVFSSEKALALFLVFALYELAFGSLRYNWKKIMPFFSISFVLLVLYVAKIGYRTTAIETQSYQAGGGMYNPFIQIPVAIGSYLKLIFWPARLTLYQTEMSFSQGQYLILLLISLVFLGAIIWSYFKNKNYFFWLVFFVITLLPTLTPFKISWIVAERYVYLGTLGIVVVMAMLFDKLLKINENAKMVGYFALTIVVASLSVRTIIRNQDWKSEDTLWIATAQVAPSGQNIHNNLGDVYARQGDMQKAIDEFKKAIEINPNYADAYHNLGNTYQAMGQLDLAMENYQKAASINPQLWQSYQNMAAIYFNAGDYQKALENIKKAAEINPTDENLKQNVELIEAKAQK